MWGGQSGPQPPFRRPFRSAPTASPVILGIIAQHLHPVLACSILAAALLPGCAPRQPHSPPPLAADPGQSAFQAYCAACHLNPAEAPPLENSPWVSGPSDRLIKIAIQGLRGPVEVAGKTYNQEMPAVGKPLTDEQVAALLSFIRRSFSPAAQPIQPSDVARVRANTRTSYWTVEDLLKDH